MKRAAGSILLLLTILGAACGNDPKPPGFEQLGGAGGAGATTASQASTNVSTTQASVSQNSAITVTHTASTDVAASSSSGDSCVDNGAEPNQNEQQAWNLGNISDDDDDEDSINGVVDGPFDPDWYKYHGADQSLTVVDPSRTLTTTGPIRLCKFVDCDNGEQANFTCPAGAQSATSPDGRPGCCSGGGFTIDDLVCGGSQFNSDDATIFIRIDNPMATPCPSYTLKYHF